MSDCSCIEITTVIKRQSQHKFLLRNQNEILKNSEAEDSSCPNCLALMCFYKSLSPSLSLDIYFILDYSRIVYILLWWCLSQCYPQTWNSEFGHRLGSRPNSSPRHFFLIQFDCHWTQEKTLSNVQQNNYAESYSYMQ